MARSGTNRTNQSEDGRGYNDTATPRIRRVTFALIICTIAASILVALLAGAVMFVAGVVLDLLGRSPDLSGSEPGFLAGAYMALMIAALNWFMFYIVLPVTLIVFSLSLGRFPRRGITSKRSYERWGVIWGSLLVGGTTGFLALFMGDAAALGSLVTGAALGAIAGLICARLFLTIVRPAKQLSEIDTEVF